MAHVQRYRSARTSVQSRVIRCSRPHRANSNPLSNSLSEFPCRSREFEFPLDVPAAAAHPAGDMVAAAGSQVVAFTATAADRVGKLARACAVGDTTVLIRINTIIMAPAIA